MFELDHVFVFPRVRGDAEQCLIDFEISIGERGVHNGQGTANVVAFFDNAYLELIWGHNQAELRSDPVRPLCLWERANWWKTGASPFGLSVRLTDPALSELPIDTWPYEAPFLPKGASIPIVTPRFAAREPLVLISVVSLAPAMRLPSRRPPLLHRGKQRKVTGVKINQPLNPPLSDGIATLVKESMFVIEEATEPWLELVWDGGTVGKVHDFHPDLPMLIRW